MQGPRQAEVEGDAQERGAVDEDDVEQHDAAEQRSRHLSGQRHEAPRPRVGSQHRFGHRRQRARDQHAHQQIARDGVHERRRVLQHHPPGDAGEDGHRDHLAHEGQERREARGGLSGIRAAGNGTCREAEQQSRGDARGEREAELAQHVQPQGAAQRILPLVLQPGEQEAEPLVDAQHVGERPAHRFHPPQHRIPEDLGGGHQRAGPLGFARDGEQRLEVAQERLPLRIVAQRGDQLFEPGPLLRRELRGGRSCRGTPIRRGGLLPAPGIRGVRRRAGRAFSRCRHLRGRRRALHRAGGGLRRCAGGGRGGAFRAPRAIRRGRGGSSGPRGRRDGRGAVLRRRRGGSGRPGGERKNPQQGCEDERDDRPHSASSGRRSTSASRCSTGA
ncbi:hypothetical protein HRbin39_01099 [bacterium HR39]|nr:hypothetical protein HRbin39_01099 [bacterium HR39]